jgi:3-deoxy-D-manno-octulosonic-acid transferase
VLVVDTIGHLMDMYAQAAIVFVGKSLTVGGGHNIIEPAAFAKPVIVGPLMQNFKDITAAFLAAGAVIQVKDALELKKEVAGLLASEERRVSLGARAREVVRSNRGATVRIVDGITRVAGAGTKG